MIDRNQYLGSSDIGSLFGVGYLSRFELWHRKAGNIQADDISEQDRVFWGTTLEPAIAAGAAAREGWTLSKAEFCPHPLIPRMSCHPDYEISPDNGLLEVKNVDALVYRDWGGEVPEHIELQLQHQFACTQRKWGAFAILVGGNALHIERREANPGTIQEIEHAVLDFWESIEAGREPEPDWSCDLPTLAKIHGHAEPGKVLDLRGHAEANALIAEYVAAREQAKVADGLRDSIKARLLPILGDAERAILGGGYSISSKRVEGGSVKYDRKSYRDFRITQNKRFALVEGGGQ